MWQQCRLSSFVFTVSILSLMMIFSSSFVAPDAFPAGVECPIQSIYQFGDSVSDTGNLVKIIPTAPATRLPYGITFPGKPTGRWSDGRLIIDYIATSLGLPLLNPNKNSNASFENGASFSVAGATALSTKFYIKRGIVVLPVPSLEDQLREFHTFLKPLCSTPIDCKLKLSRSLVFVGEFGYNDIAYAYVQRRSLGKIQSFLPLVNQLIINATREVIQTGAKQVIVPNLFPLGCFPFTLNAASRPISEEQKDSLGCLKELNDIIAARNNDLKRDVDLIKLEFPDVNILQSNLYDAFFSLLREAPLFGFEEKFKSCCGLEKFYAPLGPVFCGDGDVPLCPNPNTHVHWDGLHLTQAANQYLANHIIRDLNLKCNN